MVVRYIGTVQIFNLMHQKFNFFDVIFSIKVLDQDYQLEQLGSINIGRFSGLNMQT